MEFYHFCRALSGPLHLFWPLHLVKFKVCLGMGSRSSRSSTKCTNQLVPISMQEPHIRYAILWFRCTMLSTNRLLSYYYSSCSREKIKWAFWSSLLAIHIFPQGLVMVLCSPILTRSLDWLPAPIHIKEHLQDVSRSPSPMPTCVPLLLEDFLMSQSWKALLNPTSSWMQSALIIRRWTPQHNFNIRMSFRLTTKALVVIKSNN